jgi:hypothetical protein
MKKIRCFLSILFFVAIFNLASAQQFPSELWYDGKVVLMEGDTISGKLKYDFDMDMVQLNIRNTLRTFSARKILYFEIYDTQSGALRRFYSLPFRVEPTYKTPIIFEVLYEGKLSLLCREVVVTESVPSYSYYGYRQPMYATRARLDYVYYFLDSKGDIQRYLMKRPELIGFMKDKSTQVRQYMKKHKLKHDNRNDLFRIVAYYNALLGK